MDGISSAFVFSFHAGEFNKRPRAVLEPNLCNLAERHLRLGFKASQGRQDYNVGDPEARNVQAALNRNGGRFKTLRGTFSWQRVQKGIPGVAESAMPIEHVGIPKLGSSQARRIPFENIAKYWGKDYVRLRAPLNSLRDSK